jgi:nucleoside-diphosphate-sugar epimerase
MKVMLTGASGFIGQYCLRALLAQGIPVVAVGRTCPHGLAPSSCISADLLATTDFPALARAAGASHLLHLAWCTEHGKYWRSPLNYRWVDATTRLVQAFCESGGSHVVAVGTCAEYDWGRGVCREDETPLEPASVYGVAKDATWRLVRSVCAGNGARCSWARVFFPYGAGEDPQRLVPRLSAALRGQCAPFGVSAQSRRDYLHACDVATGLLTLLRSGAHDAYNVSSGEPVLLGDLVRALAQLLRADPRQVLDLAAERAGDAAIVAGDNSKLRALGWRPGVTLAQGLEQALHGPRARDHDMAGGVQSD